MVEQWTENPCVPSSILGGTTKHKVPEVSQPSGLFYCYQGARRRSLFRERLQTFQKTTDDKALLAHPTRLISTRPSYYV